MGLAGNQDTDIIPDELVTDIHSLLLVYGERGEFTLLLLCGVADRIKYIRGMVMEGGEVLHVGINWLEQLDSIIMWT